MTRSVFGRCKRYENPWGVLVHKEGDGPGGVNTLVAYCPATDEVFLGFTKTFGHFDEVDFMIDDVIGKMNVGK